MKVFSKQLLAIRKKLGHKSAKSFYEYLKEHGELGFNYSYYIRIENGDSLPSSKVVNVMAHFLPDSDAQMLIHSFCQALFPKFQHLFFKQFDAMSEDLPEKRDSRSKPIQSQMELSIKQISQLLESRDTYHLFLLLTLSRRAIERKELATYFDKKSLEEAIKSLKNAKFIVETADKLRASALEVKFPDPYNEYLKDAHEKMDQWDAEMSEKFDLKVIEYKLFNRRISLRYLSIIQNHLNLLFDIIRTSDELDQRYNDTVIQLDVKLKKGKLPG